MFFLFYIFKFWGALIIWAFTGFRKEVDIIYNDNQVACQVVSGLSVIIIIALAIYL